MRRTTARAAVSALIATAAVALLVGSTPVPAGAAVGDIDFPTDEEIRPRSVTVGPDGNLWFVGDLSLVGRSTLDGEVTLFEDPLGQVDNPHDITAGPDGNLWFTMTGADRFGRVTPDGTITTFEDPGGDLSLPLAITAGPDDMLWFVHDAGGAGDVGRFDPDAADPMATIELFDDPAGMVDFPRDITPGPDGNLWFTSETTDRIGMIDPDAADPASTIETYTHADVDRPMQLTTGPDGNLWFTSYGSDRVGRLRPQSGFISTFADGTGELDEPTGITVGADGNLWVTGQESDSIVRVTTEGAMTVFDQPGNGVNTPVGITAAPDGDVWFANRADSLGRVEVCSGAVRTDVSPQHPFFTDICWMITEGISTGYGDGSFKPAAAVSRQAMSAFMYRLAGEPPVAPGDPSFSDVPADHPFFDEIEWMAAEGVSTGYGDGTYRPADPVTRQAMSAFIYRLAGSPDTGDPEPSFSDVPTDHPFFDEIEWMAAKAITTGYADGTYKPAANVSRQAMSAFMHRFGVNIGVNL